MLLMLARVSWEIRPRIDCRWAMVLSLSVRCAGLEAAAAATPATGARAAEASWSACRAWALASTVRLSGSTAVGRASDQAADATQSVATDGLDQDASQHQRLDVG